MIASNITHQLTISCCETGLVTYSSKTTSHFPDPTRINYYNIFEKKYLKKHSFASMTEYNKSFF